MATRSEHEIRFRANFSGMRRDFAKGQKMIGGFAKTFGGLGGMGGLLAGAGIVGAATDFGRQASELRDANRRTGILIEPLQRLKYAAEQSGLALDDMTKIYLRFVELQERARRGQTQTLENLRALGIDPKQAGEMTTMEFLERMAEAVQPESALGPLRLLLPELGPRFRQAAAQDIPGLMAQATVIDAALIERTASNMDALAAAMNEFNAKTAPVFVELITALVNFTRIFGWLNRQGSSAGGPLGTVTSGMAYGPGSVIGALSSGNGSVAAWFRELISENKRTNALLESEP